MEPLPDIWLKEEGQQQEEGGEEEEEEDSRSRLEEPSPYKFEIQEFYSTNPVQKFKNQKLKKCVTVAQKPYCFI